MTTRKRRKQPVPRWLPWALGLAAAAAGLWALSRPEGPSGPPLDDIDPESRARLEEVLREAEDPDSGTR